MPIPHGCWVISAIGAEIAVPCRPRCRPPGRPSRRLLIRRQCRAMYGRPKPKPPPARVPPGAAVTAAEFAELPFGGHAGEWLSGERPASAPAPPQPLVIEPPPWAGGDAGPFVPLGSVPAAGDTTPTALEVMRAEDGDDADRWPDPTAPVEVVAPMVRFVPPPADWRAE